jgi:hypothetical protein
MTTKNNETEFAKLVDSTLASVSEVKERLMVVPISKAGMSSDLVSINKNGINLGIVLSFPEFSRNVRVTKSMCDDYWNISASELFDAAFKNTKEKYKPVITDMFGMLAKLGSEVISQNESAGNARLKRTFILTNEMGFKGAAQIFVPGVAEEIAKSNIIGGSFIILPSSIHELIIIPDKDNDKFLNQEGVSAITSMITSINLEQVDEEDQLADIPFHYDSATKQIETLEDFVNRDKKESMTENMDINKYDPNTDFQDEEIDGPKL